MFEVPPGFLLAVDRSIKHDVEAVADSAFLKVPLYTTANAGMRKQLRKQYELRRRSQPLNSWTAEKVETAHTSCS
jgi:hypothetical protein